MDEEDYYDDENPCTDCKHSDYCDGWEAKFCCDLCRYFGGDDCEHCDPMDI